MERGALGDRVFVRRIRIVFFKKTPGMLFDV